MKAHRAQSKGQGKKSGNGRGNKWRVRRLAIEKRNRFGPFAKRRRGVGETI
jgi:hypothetical protein